MYLIRKFTTFKNCRRKRAKKFIWFGNHCCYFFFFFLMKIISPFETVIRTEFFFFFFRLVPPSSYSWMTMSTATVILIVQVVFVCYSSFFFLSFTLSTSIYVHIHYIRNLCMCLYVNVFEMRLLCSMLCEFWDWYYNFFCMYLLRRVRQFHFHIQIFFLVFHHCFCSLSVWMILS